MKAVGGERVLANLPNGYDEPVIEKGSTLSSGQRQLISFARALAFDPAILILDEATSNIDTETEEIIQHAMDVLKKKGVQHLSLRIDFLLLKMQTVSLY